MFGFAVVTFSGCDNDGPLENAGEAVDEAVEDMKDSAQEAKNDMQDAADDVQDKMDWCLTSKYDSKSQPATGGLRLFFTFKYLIYSSFVYL